MCFFSISIGTRWWDILGYRRAGHQERKRPVEMYDFKRRFSHYGLPDYRNQYNNIGFWG